MGVLFFYISTGKILGECFMTSSVNTNFNKDDVYTLIQYNKGITPGGYSFNDAMIGAGIMGGGYSLFKGGQWLINNRKDYKAGWQNVQNGFTEAKKLKGANLKESYLNNYRNLYISDLEARYKAPKTLSAAEQAKLSPAKLAKYNRQQAISAEYDKMRQLIKDSKGLKGQDLLNKQKEINQALADAKLAVAKGKATAGSAMAPTTKVGKAGQWLKGKTGITKAEIAVKTSAAKGGYAKFLPKALKGTPATTVVALALEAPTVYKTYKQLGAAKGTKQLAKSAAIAGAGVAGYALGSMALGAAVGSVVPIAGTAVGAVVGLVGGLIGAWGADTLARKLLPSELELAAQKEAEEAMQDPEKMQQILKETEEAAANETDAQTLEKLQSAYDNISGTLAAGTQVSEGAGAETQTQTPGGNPESTTTSGNTNPKGVDALKKALENLITQFKSNWNFYNPQDLYNSLRPYEKPVYPMYVA